MYVLPVINIFFSLFFTGFPDSRLFIGKDIEGLTLFELVQLEKTLGKGMNRIVKRKVHGFAFIYFQRFMFQIPLR